MTDTTHDIKLGDNLKIMQAMQTASIDLIATDPPYGSMSDYRDADGNVQFTDKWRNLDEYLDMMRPVLQECHRLLASTGSLYLIVDASASHYLKVELDRIFGIKNFRRDVNWVGAKPGGFSGAANNWVKTSYRILYYCKGSNHTFNKIYGPLLQSSVERYRSVDADGRRYQNHSDPSRIIYLDDSKGRPVTDDWTDITIQRADKYPTQKPLKLLERIICASSDIGQVVLDPFSGSGTTCVAAKKLGRSSIGIDQNPEAVAIANSRLADTQPDPDELPTPTLTLLTEDDE